MVTFHTSCKLNAYDPFALRASPSCKVVGSCYKAYRPFSDSLSLILKLDTIDPYFTLKIRIVKQTGVV